MKFTLKDYQREAFEDVIARLEQGRTVYHRDGKPTSFALTATTGAGKTVMAAAAIETLFFGNDALDVEADPGAVVIWFSDDPSLNDQTRSRLMQASEKLISPDLIRIAPPFSQPRLQPRKVYFLNTQRLTKSSLLTRGHVADLSVDALPGLDAQTQPDMQGWTIWQTIANTVDADGLTVYLVLDEAHRGFGARTSSDKPTIVRRLVNGHAGYPPIPVVWGISATIENFRKVMDAADADDSRGKLKPVQVAPSSVQESGLVKDVVSLDIPAERGNFDSVLVRRAARLLRESTQRWRDYGRSQGTDDIVRPLLVLQVPNKPNPDEIGVALDTIVGEYPEVGSESIRHVLGDHTTQRFGLWEVEHIEPPRVEETTKVRVLIAKDGISTGWDCPRAEVLVSFRTATEPTHITQLLGRMVRNPLARRVPGDERLNAVDCILPFFDRTTAVNVVKYLTGQIDNMPAGSTPKVLQDGRELQVNPSIPDAVWGCWDDLPTMTMPQRGARPTTRLVALAQRLSADGVRPGAVKEVHEELHAVLDGYAVRYRKLLDDAVAEVWAVRGQTIAGKVGRTDLAYSTFTERADDRAIRAEFDKARKAFGADVALAYADHLAGPDDENDDLTEAFVKASALATVPEVREKVDEEASELADHWFAEHNVAIKALPDLRRAEYGTIRAQTTEPRLEELQRPRTRMEDYAPLDQDTGVSVPSPLLSKHLMSDEDGMFPIASLNDWERSVVAQEVSRPECVGWYRNPSRTAVDSLGISYRDTEGNWRSMHPDFIFFDEIDGQVRASLVDPHGHHLDDAKTKLICLAGFARDHGAAFERIEAVSKIGSTMKMLDLQLEPVRNALLHGKDTPMELYQSDVAIDYDAAGHGSWPEP